MHLHGLRRHGQARRHPPLPRVAMEVGIGPGWIWWMDAEGWVVLCVVGNLHVGDVGARYRTSTQYVRILRISRSRQLENSSIYQ